MKKNLEDFIRQNRNEFDSHEPSENVWKRISNSLWGNEVSLWNNIMLWRAAAVVFLSLSAYLFLAKPETKQVDASLVAKEFTEVESFYTAQINEKVKLIHDLKGEGLNGFTHDFQQLEAMYNVLKEELKIRPSEKVKDALELNLLVRVDLLNQQLYKLEKEKLNKTEVLI